MQNKAKNKNKGRQGVCSERVIFVREPERRGGWGLSKLIGQERTRHGKLRGPQIKKKGLTKYVNERGEGNRKNEGREGADKGKSFRQGG